MSMSGQNDPKQDPGSQEQGQGSEHAEAGHTGEGAASAMARMISQGQQHRHQTGEAGGATGGHGQ